jgi:hypothetical protein
MEAVWITGTREALGMKVRIALKVFALSCVVCAASVAMVSVASDTVSTVIPQAGDAGGGQLYVFAMDGMPLSDALSEYATITGRSVIYRDDQVAGIYAPALRGRYQAERALNVLLEGSGLMISGDAGDQTLGLVLKRGQIAAGTSAVPDKKVNRQYDSLLQWRVWQTLCSHARTRPGSYRLMLQVTVNPHGDLSSVKLLTSSGDRVRDKYVYAVLKEISTGVKPPADLQQPLILMILPRDTMSGQACGGSSDE